MTVGPLRERTLDGEVSALEEQFSEPVFEGIIYAYDLRSWRGFYC